MNTIIDDKMKQVFELVDEIDVLWFDEVCDNEFSPNLEANDEEYYQLEKTWLKLRSFWEWAREEKEGVKH